jgi:hypothetical protein
MSFQYIEQTFFHFDELEVAFSDLPHNLWTANGVKTRAVPHDAGELRDSTLEGSVRGGAVPRCRP